MRQLELLAPAKDRHIGIAAIDCGADAVYIAGPRFGARQAAGNSVEDIRGLCSYAHRFGARIFVTLNTILFDDETEEAWEQMLAVQEAGADAIIVQDMAVIEMVRQGGPHNCKAGPGDKDTETMARKAAEKMHKFRLPLHASTQCAIRTPEQAVWLESLGFSRLILERELSLEQIRAIRESVSCELEFFVHGALCVCYSGQCYLSEMIAGRSANRGACIQACRSRYDLTDASGKILVKDKALLSLKDYNLCHRLEELAEAGITSFKIEGRLKNSSYVRNVVRDYSITLDDIVGRHPEKYERGSFGSIGGGFVPDTSRTFNRGYTGLFIDGRRGRWAAMDAAKSMGQAIGIVTALNRDRSSVTIQPAGKDITLCNGDGFSFVAKDGNVTGFRGDVCNGNTIRCKSTPSLFIGARLFRNNDTIFEKEIERNPCTRVIHTSVAIDIRDTADGSSLSATALTEDGRTASVTLNADSGAADNQKRMHEMFISQIGKTAGHYRFTVSEIRCDHALPFMSASSLNGIRRRLSELLDELSCNKKDILCRTSVICQDKKDGAAMPCPAKNVSYKYNVSNRLAESLYRRAGAESVEPAYELSHNPTAELMRTRYCIRHELGICIRQGHKSGNLFLVNNGRRFALHFDCRNCEMTLTEITASQSQK